jgi:spore germination protein YaaH
MFSAVGTTRGKPLKVIGFFTEDASKKGLVAIGRDPKALSDLSPWWYTLNSDGSVKDMSTAATRAWSSSHHVPIVPLVTNGGQYTVLEDNTAMHTAIQNLVSLVQKNNYDGLNIDFQGLPFQARSGLNAFVDELASQLHGMNKTVAVDIIPTQAQTGAHGAYDEVSLSHYADQLILMTYDRHDNTSSPGPVSPHNWVVSAVKHALAEGVPASKIVLGVNSYGYDWNLTTGKGSTVGQAQASAMPPSKKTYSHATKETKVTFTKNGVKHVIYYGGRKALADKIAIAKQYKLAGIAIWKVGYENQGFWQELLSTNGNAASGTSTSTTSGAGGSAATHTRRGHNVGKPMTHRPIGARHGVKPHGGTARSHSGKVRGKQ